MKVRYDKDVDAMYINLDSGEYEVSEEVGDGVVLDVSKDGKIIGIEILDASEKISKGLLQRLILEKHN